MNPQHLRVSSEPDELAPDGSRIHLLCRNQYASTCLCVLAAGQVSMPVRHRSVEEIWYVVSGVGELHRANIDGGRPLRIEAGDSLSIAAGAVFQFRALSDAELRLLIVTSPPWPGDEEADCQVGAYWPVPTGHN